MLPVRHLVKLSLLIATLAIAVLWSCGKSSSPKRRGPVAEVIYPVCCRVSGEVPANYRLIDRQSDPASAEISYSTDGGLTFQLATESLNAASDGTSNLATAPKRGVLHVFIWDTVADFGYVETAGVQFKVYPYDSYAGKASLSPPFVVDNTVFVPPEVIEVSDSVVSTVANEVTIRFSKPIDPSSLIHQGTTGDTFAVFRDRDGIAGGPMDSEVGTVLLVDGGRLLSYVPPFPFSRGR